MVLGLDAMSIIAQYMHGSHEATAETPDADLLIPFSFSSSHGLASVHRGSNCGPTASKLTRHSRIASSSSHYYTRIHQQHSPIFLLQLLRSLSTDVTLVFEHTPTSNVLFHLQRLALSLICCASSSIFSLDLCCRLAALHLHR